MLANSYVFKLALSLRQLKLTISQAIINLTSEAPRFKPEFEQSMHKTFTDVYFAKGFTGGGWSYAINSNDAEGVDVESEGGQLGQLEETERKLAYYVIGWDSIAV